jgi:glycosyltransferase involved in cell wall biosynthesis
MGHGARRPRVLGVIASSVPGGAEAVFAALLKGLHDRFEPFVVCDNQGSMIERYRSLAVDLQAIPLASPRHIGAAGAIQEAIDRWSIDLVHTHLWNADLFGAWAATRRRRPAVSTVHGSNFLPFGTRGTHRLRRRALSLTYRAVYRLCDRVIAPSRTLADDLTARAGVRVPAGRITIVPNGLELDETRARAAQGEILPAVLARLRAPLIVCVGNMFAIKGQEWLIRAMPDVLRTVPGATAVFVGDGETRLDMERLAALLGLAERVVFTGSLDNPLPLVAKADVFVMPSLSEGLPIALLEAMALARPIVASRVGGIPEVVRDDVSGVLVPSADPAALSQAIVRVLTDGELGARLGEAARDTVAHDWSSERMVDRTAAVYDEVIAGRVRSRTTR